MNVKKLMEELGIYDPEFSCDHMTTIYQPKYCTGTYYHIHIHERYVIVRLRKGDSNDSYKKQCKEHPTIDMVFGRWDEPQVWAIMPILRAAYNQ